MQGDYVEFKNCKSCGAMIFRNQSSAIKHKDEQFHSDISPAQLLTKMFSDETRLQSQMLMGDALNESKNYPAMKYMGQRDKLVEKMTAMSNKFEQR